MKIYQLRIQLKDVDPAVWRSVRVPAAITLAKLHKVFQVVMGWDDSHLHEFRIGAMRYGIPDPDFQDEQPVVAEKRTVLGSVRNFVCEPMMNSLAQHESLFELDGQLRLGSMP